MLYAFNFCAQTSRILSQNLVIQPHGLISGTKLNSQTKTTLKLLNLCKITYIIGISNSCLATDKAKCVIVNHQNLYPSQMSVADR